MLAVFWQFLWLGCVSFGGPSAHIGYFQRTFVQRLAWLSQEQFAGLLALCQLLPGPSSSQLGFAIGRHRAGLLGAIAAFIGFTLPSFLLLLGVALGVDKFSQYGWFGEFIHGLKLLAVVVVADALLSMGRQFCYNVRMQGIMVAVAASTWLWPSMATQLLALAFAGLYGGWGTQAVLAQAERAVQPLPKMVPLSGFVLLLVLLSLLPTSAVGALVRDFYHAGSLVFGGGHVVLPLLQERLAGQLTESQFLTGYSLAQLVPGPMFTLATYLGALILPTAPVLGASLATLAIFLPGFLLLWALLPCWQSWASSPRLAGAIAAINSAVVGLLLAAFYQPVWQSAVLSTNDMAQVLMGFYLLRGLKVALPQVALLLLVSTLLWG